jgi:hypothetical protein
MPTLDAYRIINISYDKDDKRIDDLIIETGGRHTIVVIPNGCGKTYSITLLLQTIIPGMILNNRTFEETFSNVKGTAHVIVSHTLENSTSKLFTGFTVNNEGSIQYFNWCLEAEQSMNIKDLPLGNDDMSLSYEETREWLKALPFERRARIFNQGDKKGLSKHINIYGIFTDEWEMMYKMNQTEGGIKEIFEAKSRKSTDDLLSEFVIPTLKRELKGIEEVDQVQASFLKKIETLKMIPLWEEKIKKMDEYLSIYRTQLEKLKRLYDREEGFRIKLYTLKLINEKTSKHLQELQEELKKIQLRLAAQKEGENKLLTREHQLIFANTLYKIETANYKIHQIEKDIALYEAQFKTFQQKEKLILAMEDLEKYNSEEARYEIIKKQLELKQKEDKSLQQDMEILESKLFDYYTEAIKEQTNTLASYSEHIDSAEGEKDAGITQISILNGDKNKMDTDRNFLLEIEKEIDKLDGLNLYEKTKILNIKTTALIKEKQQTLTKTDKTNELRKNKLKDLEIEEYRIKDALKSDKARLEEFNSQIGKLSQILRIFHMERPDELLDHLRDAENEILIKILSEKADLSKTEEIVAYCSRFGTLPPNAEIKNLSSQLRNIGFQDFIPGYDYLRENDNTKNSMLEYGIICENLSGLSKALKKIKRPDWPIMIFSREEIKNQTFPLNEGILKMHSLFIETEYLSLSDGIFSVETYINKKNTRIKKAQERIQKRLEKQNELELYRKITETFIDTYGIDIQSSREALKNRFSQSNKNWSECAEKRALLKKTITETEERLLKLKDTSGKLEAEKEKYFQTIRQFEKIEQRCFHLIESLDFLYSRIEELNDKKKDIDLEISNKQMEQKKIKEYIKRLTKKTKEITENFGALKQKRKKFKKHHPENPVYSYKGESPESLEIKLAILKMKFDDNQLIEEEKRTFDIINTTKSKILNKGYTIEELRKVDRTELPDYDDCVEQREQLRKSINTAQKNLGQHTAEKHQLLSICKKTTLTEEITTTIIPLESKQFTKKSPKTEPCNRNSKTGKFTN